MNPPVVHVTGARPNFPKAAPIIAGLEDLGVDQLLVHTGQHYDDRMSDVFFRQLGLPAPDVNLGVGSGSHARQTGAIMAGLEDCFNETEPAAVIVYGDVNSTVAASLVASKMHIPLVHVEAGLRSFDMSMPEEVNRLVTDRLSDLLLVTSPDAIAHLAHEGVPADRIHFVGNPMIDTLLRLLPDVPTRPSVGFDLPDLFVAATLHRPGNVDNLESLLRVRDAMHRTADLAPVVIPVHPRGRAVMEENAFFDHPEIYPVDPLAYLDFVSLMRASACVVTDSGGVQEETTVLGVPCLTLRPNTERPITITHGTNVLTTPERLADDVCEALAPHEGTGDSPIPPLWDGQAGARAAALIARISRE
ncbi:UDP-N-acetylglucosamine 2-epimerase (non-hydrolyzing) [Nocardioides guangzhouensis]|uniref:UDP-N-acetylglucosamine 2-epimerase (Non-hydrolyzing) n=1 Tax=Nocardioides guangzhouensis TaxID=2497878 RepID=A0A4Q4Z9X0_9ACTN|nr:UDP-N-acetylglucosamine 2-epimerase (non-hydrolyzing) [Nocardioides guangzhouensis]RYP83874.1 UDP-N-acetylglucosamine 2-epimerase (non-hydrolyzing) [Nocardioides guangzhouensis]